MALYAISAWGYISSLLELIRNGVLNREQRTTQTVVLCPPHPINHAHVQFKPAEEGKNPNIKMEKNL